MGKRATDSEYPEIGQQVKGMIFVCHGDDGIAECIEWLDPFITRFLDLMRYSDEIGFYLISSNHIHAGTVTSEVEFCNAIGIEFESSFWEGSFVSGTYHLGWIKKGTTREVKKSARSFLKELERYAETQIRRQLVTRISKINSLDALADEFMERASDDRDELIRRNFKLQLQLKDAQELLSSSRTKVERAAFDDTRRIDRDCLRLALAMATNTPGRYLAGPLVLWDDGIVYAIISRGRVKIPDGSTPALILAALEVANIPIVKISENTVIGGWISGPIYGKGSENINDWARVWSDRENGRNRSFAVQPEEFADTVRSIHEYFRDQSNSY